MEVFVNYFLGSLEVVVLFENFLGNYSLGNHSLGDYCLGSYSFLLMLIVDLFDYLPRNFLGNYFLL